MPEDALREALAAYAHEAWSGWMDYLFSKSATMKDDDGRLLAILPPEQVERWVRQMNTPYAELSEQEKESDRAQADKMLDIIFKVGLPPGHTF